MTKADLQMTNHELQARVIELQNEVTCKDAELSVIKEDYKTLEVDHSYTVDLVARMEEAVEHALNEQPGIAFDVWYKRLHPRGPGSDPDLEVVRQSQYARILA